MQLCNNNFKQNLIYLHEARIDASIYVVLQIVNYKRWLQKWITEKRYTMSLILKATTRCGDLKILVKTMKSYERA